MDPDAYQLAAISTAFPYREAAHNIAQDPILAEKVIRYMYTAIGLGESGEAQEITKKHIRSMRSGADPRYTLSEKEVRELKLGELGDLLWYIANDAAEWGLSLSEIMEYNVAKLQARVDDGTLAHERRD